MNLGISREEMLGRISKALGRDELRTTVTDVPEVSDEILRVAHDQDRLPDLFQKEAEAVGMPVRLCFAKDLPHQLIALLESFGASKVVVGVEDRPLTASLADLIQDKGFEVLNWEGQRDIEPCFQADVGVTDVYCAIAESGSLVCLSDARHGRGLSLAPERHIAIVRCSDLLPDLVDLMRQEQAKPNAGRSSAMAIITGPSKTADIEGVLITGVHGPSEVHIILVGDA